MSKTRKMVCVSFFIALSLVFRYFSIMIPFAGAAGMRIGFGGFSSKLPALLFGPLYGGFASGFIDIFGFLLKPEGAYIPLLTLTAIVGGIIVGFLWRRVDKLDGNIISKIFIITSVLSGCIGFVNYLLITNATEFIISKLIISMGEKRYLFVTAGLMILCVAGLIIYSVNHIFIVRKTKLGSDYMKCFVVLLTANIIVTTLNTFVLRIFIPPLANIAFWIYYIPRVIEEIIMTMIQSYVVVHLLMIFNKYFKNKLYKTN